MKKKKKKRRKRAQSARKELRVVRRNPRNNRAQTKATPAAVPWLRMVSPGVDEDFVNQYRRERVPPRQRQTQYLRWISLT
jgi:hypothetical protein